MTTATAVPPDVAAYLAAVRASLSDLPDVERDDLVAEVEASLVESVQEGTPIGARLGPPEEFAAELRAAAGLHEPDARQRQPSRLTVLAARLARDPRVATVRRLAFDLAPIWWVVRGYLAVGALAVATGAAWSTRYPVVPRVGSAESGVALILLASALSVALGLRGRRRGTSFPRVAVALNVALLLTAVPVAQQVADTRAQDVLISMAYAPQPVAASGLVYDGIPIDNVYPFTREGKLLHDVLLYDGAGRPLEIAGNRVDDPNRRIVVTNGNEPLFNVFPIRYFEPGTRRVARPNAGPYIEHPIVLTPALRR